jgi:kynureninase
MVKAGFLPDWREPDVLRISPVPMYNTYTDVWQTANFIKEYFE